MNAALNRSLPNFGDAAAVEETGTMEVALATVVVNEILVVLF